MKRFISICFLFAFLGSLAIADVRHASKNQVVVGKVIQVLTVVPEKVGYESGVFLTIQDERSGQVYEFHYDDSFGCYQEFVNKHLSKCERVGGDKRWSKLLGHRVRAKQKITYWTSRRMIQLKVLN